MLLKICECRVVLYLCLQSPYCAGRPSVQDDFFFCDTVFFDQVLSIPKLVIFSQCSGLLGSSDENLKCSVILSQFLGYIFSNRKYYQKWRKSISCLTLSLRIYPSITLKSHEVVFLDSLAPFLELFSH